jgi:hypothetical protein
MLEVLDIGANTVVISAIRSGCGSDGLPQSIQADFTASLEKN